MGGRKGAASDGFPKPDFSLCRLFITGASGCGDSAMKAEAENAEMHS